MFSHIGPETGQPAITVVLPTYNERDNLPRVVEKLLALAAASVRVLVVDDNSPDGTGRVADRLCEVSAGRVSVLHRESKDGLGRAYVSRVLRLHHSHWIPTPGFTRVDVADPPDGPTSTDGHSTAEPRDGAR